MAIPISEKVTKEAKLDIRELESKIERFKNGKIPELPTFASSATGLKAISVQK